MSMRVCVALKGTIAVISRLIATINTLYLPISGPKKLLNSKFNAMQLVKKSLNIIYLISSNNNALFLFFEIINHYF